MPFGPGFFLFTEPSKTAFQKQKRERFEFEKAPNVPRIRKNTEFPETRAQNGINRISGNKVLESFPDIQNRKTARPDLKKKSNGTNSS